MFMENTKNSNKNFEAINAMRESIKAFKCNPFDSRTGSHSYSCWTTGRDYYILIGEKEFFFRYRCYNGDGKEWFLDFENPRKEDFTESVAVGYLPDLIMKKLFESLFPEGSEDEKIVFFNGLAEGLPLIEEKHWLKEHCLWGSEDLTQSVLNEIGRWDREEPRFTAGQYRLFKGDDVYEIKSWVNAGRDGIQYHHSLEKVDLAAELEAQKAFGRRARRLANAAGVPFKIAALVEENIEDTKALEALVFIKKIRANADKIDRPTRHELINCGIERRQNAICRVLGDEYAAMFRIFGQIKSRRLADFIAGLDVRF